MVFSHKPCWKSERSPSGYATDGGFPFQMHYLSELFNSTRVVALHKRSANSEGELPLTGKNISVKLLPNPGGKGIIRKILMPIWLLKNISTIIKELRRADAVHTPVPGDIGMIGMLLAFFFRKPLFVRQCGNWFVTRTVSKRFLKWFIERFAGGRNVMLATGGASINPSARNSNVSWIFSTTLSKKELDDVSKIRDRLPKERTRLIIVGRQEIGKGTDVLIKSLPLIKKVFPGVCLGVVGDGMALPVFQKMAQTLGIDDSIIFHGKVGHTEVIRLLHKADLFCFPTASEGFPKAVLEALACGLPVVTTRVSVLPSLVGKGCGRIVDEITPEAVAEAINYCLSDSNRYSEMSARAMEIAGRYSLERWRDEIGILLSAAWGDKFANPVRGTK